MSEREDAEIAEVLAPELRCYLIIASWAPVSIACQEIFEKVKADNVFENLTFVLRDYDKDYTTEQIEKYKIKAAPLWRICSGPVVKYDHYGQLASSQEFYELIERYLYDI